MTIADRRGRKDDKNKRGMERKLVQQHVLYFPRAQYLNALINKYGVPYKKYN